MLNKTRLRSKIVLKSRCWTKRLCASVTNCFMWGKDVKNRNKFLHNLQTQLDTIKVLRSVSDKTHMRIIVLHQFVITPTQVDKAGSNKFLETVFKSE